ncbi:hypothetical protein SMKI_16G2320 [Saccharomyces mikatae IFO 1815]|uniref:YPR071W-like protein n=1 Tax=Saccharomyces mikatae IFO 1815 TaxID=226126 RepID=A0AA35IVK6_SACMI|nr:uncharacterized protein SMKI_16G2320 [Saccharomyces mikatae IFO 1815]CAI4036935.1 hypothetical protein SMKI_16G2320 [Saccharomyces mikatae IFO 1815]
MQNIKVGRSGIPAIQKDTVLPSLAVRLTTKVMRLLFIAKMLQYSFISFKLWTPDTDINWIIAYSVIVSIWGFAVWMERSYRNKMNLQPPRCTKIRCSRCNTRKRYPKLFKCKQWVYFLLLFVTLTLFNFVVQLAYTAKEMITSGVDIRYEEKKIGEDEITPLLLLSLATGALIHLMIARTFKNYYLHNGPFETDNETYADEKQSVSEKVII